jgi:thiazole synthase
MWKLADQTFNSRLLIGTARYPSPTVMRAAIENSGAEIVTVSLRRQAPESRGGDSFWSLLKSIPNIRLLPNTAGCRTAKEAITTAHLARELFETNWVKLEVIGDEQNLIPDPFGLVEAARVLSQDGFEVFPYTTHDLILGERLLHAGCRILMPWGSYIGSGQGLRYREELITMRRRFPETPLIVDAGIGRPSHAAEAMELGMDGVLLNTAIAIAGDPAQMAEAFAGAIRAGRLAYQSVLMERRNTAEPSTPVVGTPFWHVQP